MVVEEEWPRSSLTGESERAREEGERNGGRESGGGTYSQSCAGLGWAGLGTPAPAPSSVVLAQQTSRSGCSVCLSVSLSLFLLLLSFLTPSLALSPSVPRKSRAAGLRTARTPGRGGVIRAAGGANPGTAGSVAATRRYSNRSVHRGAPIAVAALPSRRTVFTANYRYNYSYDIPRIISHPPLIYLRCSHPRL